MSAQTPDVDRYSAWNPGVGAGVPVEFRSLETIFRPEWVFSSPDYVKELASLTGLPHEELAVFRPRRLALHELIIRVTADIAIAEGEEEEAFGQNFRRTAAKILDDYIAPSLSALDSDYAELQQRAAVLVREVLAQTLDPPTVAPAPRRFPRCFPFSWLRQTKQPVSPLESVTEREHRVISAYKAAGLSAADPLRRAVFKSLYRVLGATAATHGRIGSSRELLAQLVSQHVCNTYGSQLIGQQIAPLVEEAIREEGYTRIPNRSESILISLKGASASGKSSLRPMLKQMLRKQGIEADGYATISPDVWRRLLLDYESLGPAHKYAGHLTSRELMVIDGKLDRYIRRKANRDQAIPHILVDRFRFDSFSSRKVTHVLDNTYARYVSTMYMYFIVTPPEETVERGWQRALERGRYKAVEDFLGHCVEAYQGMPKLLFKWLAYRPPEYRYFFLDNRVPKGTFPKTIAFGDQAEIIIYDPLAFIDIERYQKIDINAVTAEAVYPAAQFMTVAMNAGFLKECIRRIALVNFVDSASAITYLRVRQGVFEVLDHATLARLANDEGMAAVLAEIAPGLAIDGV